MASAPPAPSKALAGAVGTRGPEFLQAMTDVLAANHEAITGIVRQIENTPKFPATLNETDPARVTYIARHLLDTLNDAPFVGVLAHYSDPGKKKRTTFTPALAREIFKSCWLGGAATAPASAAHAAALAAPSSPVLRRTKTTDHQPPPLSPPSDGHRGVQQQELPPIPKKQRTGPAAGAPGAQLQGDFVDEADDGPQATGSLDAGAPAASAAGGNAEVQGALALAAPSLAPAASAAGGGGASAAAPGPTVEDSLASSAFRALATGAPVRTAWTRAGAPQSTKPDVAVVLVALNDPPGCTTLVGAFVWSLRWHQDVVGRWLGEPPMDHPPVRDLEKLNSALLFSLRCSLVESNKGKEHAKDARCGILLLSAFALRYHGRKAGTTKEQVKASCGMPPDFPFPPDMYIVNHDPDSNGRFVPLERPDQIESLAHEIQAETTNAAAGDPRHKLKAFNVRCVTCLIQQRAVPLSGPTVRV